MDPLLAKRDAMEESLEATPTAVASAGAEVHPLKSLGRGSVITLIGQLVLVGSTFGIRVLLVTNLTSALYGDLALGLSITGIITNLCALGLPSAMARQLAHTIDPKDRQKLVVLSLEVLVPVALLSGAGLYLAAPVFGALYAGDPNITLVVQLLAVNMTFGLLAGLLVAFFQGNEDAVPNSLFSQILSPGLTVVFLLVFLPHFRSLQTALDAYIAASVVALAALVAYTLSSRGFPWRRAGSLDLAREGGPTLSRAGLLVFAFPLALVAIASAADGTADTIVLGLFRSASSVGAYNSVLPLARLVALAVGALAFIMLPVAARLHRLSDMEELRRSYATITKWVVLVTLPFFLTFFFLPGPSLSFVYGAPFLNSPGYSGTPELLQVTCLGGMAATLMGPSQAALIGLGKFRRLALFTGISAVSDLGIALVLVPFLGSLGAAIANAAATALLPVLSTAETYREAGVHPFTPAMAKPLLLVAVPFGIGLATLYGPLHWWPGPRQLVAVFLVLLAASLGSVAATQSVEAEDGHLLEIAEEYLGRPLPWLRRVGKRFLAKPDPRT